MMITIKFRKDGNKLRGTCPFCASSEFIVNLSKQLYCCFCCDASGNLTSFLRRLEGRILNEQLDILYQPFRVQKPFGIKE